MFISKDQDEMHSKLQILRPVEEAKVSFPSDVMEAAYATEVVKGLRPDFRVASGFVNLHSL